MWYCDLIFMIEQVILNKTFIDSLLRVNTGFEQVTKSHFVLLFPIRSAPRCHVAHLSLYSTYDLNHSISLAGIDRHSSYSH